MKLINGSIDSDEDKPVTIMLCQAIGTEAEGGMTSKGFGEILSYIPAKKEVKMLLDCPGGYVSMGTAIYNMIRARGNVDVCVIGCAASMGAVILQAGRKRTMMTGSFMMIHDPEFGDGKTEGLDVIKNGLVDILAQRSGMRRDSVSKLMSKTTYMGPEEAKKNGFCDSVEDSARNEYAPTPEDTFRICQAINNLSHKPAEPDDAKKEKPKMKTLIAAMASCALLPSADMSDEAAIVREFNTRMGKLKDLETENTTLTNRVKEFSDAQKKRVTVAVDSLITDKLVKAERKDALIKMGERSEDELTDFISDLRAAKGTTENPQRRGTAPVKKEGDEPSDTETKMATLRTELSTCSASRAIEIGRELRDLRGHKELFTAAK
jgi:ATP-dependent Clp endopeptidase proteolytic subunit ClpP